jgi:hypothetical protein
MVGHRWSGWPGAWCLDCGIEDPLEAALATNEIEYVESDEPEYKEHGKPVYTPELQERLNSLKDCPEPGSNRHNPYYVNGE